jgi:hypothetical protein
LPAAAIVALRGHIDRFLRLHGVVEGHPLVETEADTLDLAEMLVAGLRYVSTEHPWLGRKGQVLEAPETDTWEVPFAVNAALPYVEPLTIDVCIDVLLRVKDVTVVQEPCGRQQAAPCVYPYRGFGRTAMLGRIDLADQVFGVVAEEGWSSTPNRWNAAFDAAIPRNFESHGFVEFEPDAGARLAAFLMAGPQRRTEHTMYREEAHAFVRMFGPDTRVFGLESSERTASEDPFEQGHAWSQYGEDGCGCWGRTLVVVVTDGARLAYLDRVWDVTCE